MRPERYAERYAGARSGRASLYLVLGSLDFVLKAEKSFGGFFFFFFSRVVT